MIWDVIWTRIKCGMLRYYDYFPVPTVDVDTVDNMDRRFLYFEEAEDRMGMTVTSGCVKITKDESNLIGISIGGGAPDCICLYIVQVFDNTPVAKEGTLQSGDEITSVNGESVKGKTKAELAKMIQSIKKEVAIGYNKLHADPKQGKTLDIVLKKMKHRIVETMSSSTADALGLSRAILQNDDLVKKMRELEQNELVYKGLVDHIKRMLKAFYDLCQAYKAFGDIFADIGVHEPQPRASEAFTEFGEAHRTMEKYGIKFVKCIKPMLTDLGTYLNKAIPDTKLTIKKYADVKFEYLSYCLKVKEMDDEECTYHNLQEPLYRVETGNYEYRLLLRCRQDARSRFSQLRSDVLVKMELLNHKHVQDIVFQTSRLLASLSQYHSQCYLLMENVKVFPIDLDLPQTTFQYSDVATGISASKPYLDEDEEDDDDDDDEPILAEEAKESTPIEHSTGEMRTESKNICEELLSLDLNAKSSQDTCAQSLFDQLLADPGTNEPPPHNTTRLGQLEDEFFPFSSIPARKPQASHGLPNLLGE